MSNRLWLAALGAAVFASSAVTYFIVKPSTPATPGAIQELAKADKRAIERTARNPLLARQLIKSNIELKSERLDSGETAIGMTGSKHAYIVQAPNQHRSAKNVHYTAWKYEVFRDEMRGTISRAASVGNLIEYTGSMREPFMLKLNIWCAENSCQMYFSSQYSFDASVTGFINRTEFSIQLDDKEIKKFALDLGDNFQTAIARDDLYRYLYDNLESAKKLRVEFPSGSTGQVEFDLSNFDWKKFNTLTFEESAAKLKH